MRIFIFFVGLLFALPVAAQETVTIIHDDGRKEVLELPDSLKGSVLEVEGKVFEEVPVEAVEEAPEALEGAEPQSEVKPKPDLLAFVPPRKPDIPEGFLVPLDEAEPDVAPEIVQSVTPSEALRIAIDVAPAARDFVVRMAGQNYAVIFETEDGDYRVLVNPQDGAIVEKGYLQ